jgi:type II secretion system protein G
MKHKHVRQGFTLIELLIVVAIIAILAAIAVPNFLVAQTRAKVARAKSDLRTISTALDAYRIDHNRPPNMNAAHRCISPPSAAAPTLERLTTPVAYLGGRSTFTDPFPAVGIYQDVTFNKRAASELVDPSSVKEYFYSARNHREHVQWSDADTPKRVDWYILESSGPDLMKYYMGDILNSMTTGGPADVAYISRVAYDPTNGTVSEGSIWRYGGEPVGRGKAFKQVVDSANQ